MNPNHSFRYAPPATATLVAAAFACGAATAAPLQLGPAPTQIPSPPPRQAAVQGPNLGGGFIEMLFGGAPHAQSYGHLAAPAEPGYEEIGNPSSIDPRYLKQEVDY